MGRVWFLYPLKSPRGLLHRLQGNSPPGGGHRRRHVTAHRKRNAGLRRRFAAVLDTKRLHHVGDLWGQERCLGEAHSGWHAEHGWREEMSARWPNGCEMNARLRGGTRSRELLAYTPPHGSALRLAYHGLPGVERCDHSLRQAEPPALHPGSCTLSSCTHSQPRVSGRKAAQAKIYHSDYL